MVVIPSTYPNVSSIAFEASYVCCIVSTELCYSSNSSFALSMAFYATSSFVIICYDKKNPWSIVRFLLFKENHALWKLTLDYYRFP